MAKKTTGRRSTKAKSSSNKASKSPAAESTEIVEAQATEVVAESIDPFESTDDPVVEDAVEVEVEPVVEEPVETPIEETVVAETVEETTASEIVPTVPPVEQQKSNSFIPLVLGGAVAGIIGYGIATLQDGDAGAELESVIAAQAAEIATLREEVDGLSGAPDLSGLPEQISGIEGNLADAADRIDGDLAALNERIEIVERQPSADGTLQETAIAAYERDIAELREQISAQQDELRGLLSETRTEAQAIEENAIASARAATARASLAVIQGSLESGAPFGASLNDLAGSLSDSVPDALAAVAAEGVPTLAALQSEFPDAARSALATARSEGASGEDSGGFGSFLRNQFDVRSVEPQEGDSADAVLSRAEAALREGRLNDTLAELAALPEVARGALTDWTALAEQRAAALDAAATLASQLNVN